MALVAEKEYVAMKLLIAARSREMYGLEMVEKSDGLLKKGTIYVTLGRLERKGFIGSRREPHAAGIATPRRLYKITAEGARVFRALESAGGDTWLKEAMA